MTGADGRRRTILAVALAGVALALRLALVGSGPYEGEAQYRLIARGIVEGRGFFTESIEGLDPERTGVLARFRSFRPPLYPLVLAALQALFGTGDLPVLLFQSVVSALVPALVFLIGYRLFDSRVALLAGLTSAVYPYSLYHDVRPFETPVFEVLLGGLVLLLLKLAARPRLGTALAAGALVGLAIATRSFLLPFPALIALWLLVGPRLPVRQVAAYTVAIVLVAGLVLTPWIVRNYRIHGAFVPATTYGGWNFYLGNNQFALAAAREGEEVDGRLVGHLNDARVNLAGLTEVELDRWFYRRGGEFVLANPGEALVLFGLKAWNLWTPSLNPPNPRRLINLGHALSYGPILLLGVVGIAASLREPRRYALLYGLFLYFTVAYSVYLTLSRYRKPLDPYLALFAASAALRGLDYVRARLGNS